MEQLEKMKKRHSMIREIRGLGLMLGIELTQLGKPVVQAAARHGLLINCTQERILRMYPALTVTRYKIDEALRILEEALQEVEEESYEER